MCPVRPGAGLAPLAMGFFLVDVSFLNITLWDILDIAIVTYLFYRVYKLLRGSIAFNIFTGLLLLYAIWWIVNALKMELLSTILSQFVSVGVIMLIIIFQPEMRKFLLEIGRTTIGNRLEFLWKWLNIPTTGGQEKIAIRTGLLAVIRELKERQHDAVFVLDSGSPEELNFTGGLVLNSAFNTDLIESILHPDSGLRRGAVVVQDMKIHAVGARFPHSERDDLPRSISLKHRLGVGATEGADVGAIIVSGDDGSISTAYKGYLAYGISDDELERFIIAHT